MTALANELQRLLDFLRKQGHQLPTTRLRIVEVPHNFPVDTEGRIRVHYGDLREPQDYEARFEELLAAGFPWLNVSCYGVLDQALVIAIEVPAPPLRPATRTSLNFSGPIAKVLNHGWSADQVLAIE